MFPVVYMPYIKEQQDDINYSRCESMFKIDHFSNSTCRMLVHVE
jgi:hypothetical protein